MQQRDPVTGANAHLSEDDYLKVAADGVALACMAGPVSVDPDVADAMGAFVEDALGPIDAIDSLYDGDVPATDGGQRNG